jgi:predicted XRE-type DNA-binding protein
MQRQDPDSDFANSNTEPEYTASSGNVFKDLGFEDDEAENLKIRADLMISLRRFIKENGLTQEEAADFFGVNQPRISDLVNRKIEKFSIDTLVNMITQTGAEVNFRVDTSRQKRVAA